jgi:predicted transcriptional regulator
VKMALQGENTHRSRARLLVFLFPGIHLRRMQRLLGLSFSSTRYHVDVLSRTGQIERVEDGGYSRLYPPGLDGENRILFSSLRSQSKRTILKTLIENPGLTQRQLMGLTGLAKSTLSETLKALVEAQIIETTSMATGLVVYHVRDKETVLALLESTSTAVERVVDRFIDLWDL